MIPECTQEYLHATHYLEHLSKDHRTPREFRYLCTFQDCYQKAANVYTFKRHILGHESSFSSADVGEDASTKNKTSDMKSTGREQMHTEQNILEPAASNTETPILPESAYTQNLEEMHRSAVEFTLGLHNETNLSRRDVVNIQHAVGHLNTQIISKINTLLPSISSHPEVEFELKGYLRRLENPFIFIDSDYKFLNYLERSNIFRFPVIVPLESNQHESTKNFNPNIQEKQNCTIMNDIEFQLKTYFSDENVLKATINHTRKLENSNEINSFVSAQLWKEIKKKYVDEIVLPIALYSDEFEINDNLSSHNKKHSICGVYYSIVTLPDQHKSKLCNILVAAMIKKTDIGEAGHNKLFQPIVQTFKEIEERGIPFTIDAKEIKVRFVLVLVQGDNLGIHQMLQFLNFNANYYCRFCHRSRDDCRTDVEEFPEYYRTLNSYNADITINQPSETGIKMRCIFNELPSFHAVTNLCVDPMHDFYSGGLCVTGLTAVLNHCIYNKKYITLRAFNAQKSIFSKIALDCSLKRMPDISETFLTSQKRKSVVLRATASEMKALIHYFPLIVGPFVPKNDAVWTYCIVLVKLSDKILSKSYTENDILDLNNLCKQHHTLYKELFDEHLKPKHHFVSHYGHVIRTSGPVSSMMNFRNEAKHKGFKEYAHIISSRQSICYTLCVKSALQFSHDLFNREFFKCSISGSFSACDIKEKYYYTFLPLPNPINDEQIISSSTCINFKGSQFRTGNFVTVTELQNVQVFEIVDILRTEKDDLFVIALFWKVGELNEHYVAYELIEKTSSYKMFSLNDVDGPPVMPHNVLNKLYVRKKTDFLSMDL